MIESWLYSIERVCFSHLIYRSASRFTWSIFSYSNFTSAYITI